VKRAHLSRAKVDAAVNALEHVDAVAIDERGRISYTGAVNVAQAVALAVEREEAHRRMETTRVEMMRNYAESRLCRRVLLLGYYGEAFDAPCGNCDNCVRDPEQAAAAANGHREFAVGDRVEHGEWGRGEVMVAGSDRLVVLFDDAGYRQLDADIVARNDLLTRA
jgi:ATP-dependent DNA helicase RecQ